MPQAAGVEPQRRNAARCDRSAVPRAAHFADRAVELERPQDRRRRCPPPSSSSSPPYARRPPTASHAAGMGARSVARDMGGDHRRLGQVVGDDVRRAPRNARRARDAQGEAPRPLIHVAQERVVAQRHRLVVREHRRAQRGDGRARRPSPRRSTSRRWRSPPSAPGRRRAPSAGRAPRGRHRAAPASPPAPRIRTCRRRADRRGGRACPSPASRG